MMTNTEFAAARQAIGCTQPQFGVQLGLTPRHVRRLERGEVAIPRTTELAVRYLLIQQHRGENDDSEGVDDAYR